ncbi:MAG: ABC transporter substrate-binding protein [Chitinophagaceae bacterium]|nr:MAG: ABC transporter substrate-binding protein [Chitinophagaceae bacterium]
MAYPKRISIVLLLLFLPFLFACSSGNSNTQEKNAYTIGFLDAVEDATLSEARKGFTDALKANNISEEDGNLKIYFRNAQGDMATLVQSLQYFVNTKVDLIAANSTLSTITAVQRSEGIPVCMMVAPDPALAGLNDAEGNYPKNLFGVYESLDYIDSSMKLIKEWMPEAKKIGLVYNQAETQSVNALERIESLAKALSYRVIALPVTNSSETQLVTESLLYQDIDVFFALPDNIIFSSFEVILRSCEEAGVPIFTSESGLVKRGAVAAYGADFYYWGYQAGEQAAAYLKGDRSALPGIEKVQLRKKTFNQEAALKFGFTDFEGFEPVNL